MNLIKETQVLCKQELYGYILDENDKDNKNIIRFRSNIRLANSIASKFFKKFGDYTVITKEDILQEAYKGLWIACLEFDESKGYSFTTLATPYIRGSILRFLRDFNLLHMPRSWVDIRSALHRHGFTLPLSIEEVDILVEEGKYSREQILKFSDLEVLSLDSEIDDGKGSKNTQVSEIIPDTRTEEMGETLSEDEIEDLVDSIIDYIKPQHRDLVEEWIYSVLANEKLTQDELTIKYNISQAQVSRILRSSIELVRLHSEEVRNLLGY